MIEAAENPFPCNDKECTWHPPAKTESEACLQEFNATRDASNGTDIYRCGLRNGHIGSHAWRGDLPGGPKTDEKA